MVTPSKIICIGRNYKDPAAETSNDLPKEPLLFPQPLPPSCRPTAPSPSTLSTRVDYEGELAIVISRRCRNLAPDADVAPYIRALHPHQ